MRDGIQHNVDAILPASYGFALLYWMNCEKRTAAFVAAKTSSTALLTLYAYHTFHRGDRLSMISLGWHCLGDLLIALPKHFFLPAMSAFFLGHVFYIAELKKNIIQLHEINKIKMSMLCVFTAYSVAFTYLLITKTVGAIQLAIPFYSFALSMMFVFACLQQKKCSQFILSAFLYVLSDNIIGADLFLKKIPYANYLSWPLYFLAQRIMISTMNANNNEKPHAIVK